MEGPDAIAAVAAALIADADLAALLGGPHVYETPPEGAREPYLTIGPARVRDWSTATEGGAEAEVDVVLHGRRMRMREAREVLARVRAVLVFGNVSPPAGTLVNLQFLTQTTRRLPAHDRMEVAQRFRLVIET